MKAVFIDHNKTVSFLQVPEPMVEQDSDVKIRVDYCTIGELERNILLCAPLHPRGCTPGYEFVGTVVDVGQRAHMAGFCVGDLVTCVPAFFCGTCRSCLQNKQNFCTRGGESPGVLQPYVVRHHRQLTKIPDHISPKEATFLWGIAEAWEAIELSRVGVNQHIGLFGGSMSGLIVSQLVKLRGASSVTVIDNVPLDATAMALAGVDTFLDFNDLAQTQLGALRASNCYGFDAIFSVTNNPDIPGRLKGYICIGGTLCFLTFQKFNYSLTFRHGGIISKGAHIISSYLFGGDLERSKELVPRLTLTPLITAEFPFDKSLQAFYTLMHEPHLKIGITFPL